MKKVILLGALAVLSSASILAGLRHAFGNRDKGEREPLDPREAERQRIRKALGDVGSPLDLSEWPEHLRPRPDTPDRDTLRNSLPRSERPVWMDLREERDAGP
ncbi:MAG: hypothetical protein WD359_05405 [Dehalococcoidia bacterium]